MEEEIAQEGRHSRTQSPAATTTTTKESDSREVVVVTSGGGDSTMGRNRSGSTTSSVGWMGEEGASSSNIVKSPTTPRHPSKRDSGYHTDCSPATFASHPHFTFDTPETFLPALEGSPVHQQGSHEPEVTSPVSSGSTSRPRSALRSLSPGWQPSVSLPDVSSDDEGDDDAFMSDNVTVGATSNLPGSRVTFTSSMERGALSFSRGQLSSSDETVDGKADAGSDRSAALRLSGEVGEGRDGRDNSGAEGHSPRNVRFRVVRRNVDDDEEEERVACTDYHHAPLSLVRLPGGERFRPLLARTIATQTPHLHCQLIDQILACPQDFPQSARGSAVRRLRYYSEGEESVGIASLPHGPLPDIVPVSHAHRERSLSAPDLDTMQRQRAAAREVGRELRRISDEFLRQHEAMRENPNGALATLHAELNGVAAFFLTGVRRFLYRGFAGYFRHVFHWTRQAMAAAAAGQPPMDSSVDDQR